MTTVIDLSEALQITLEKLKALVGHEQVTLIMAQAPDRNPYTCEGLLEL
uniref:Uncharacterized protein n=1 Tax=Peronospora matthiolae TaxID=2874970 RepID=A0AAV1V623_9STRA